MRSRHEEHVRRAAGVLRGRDERLREGNCRLHKSTSASICSSSSPTPTDCNTTFSESNSKPVPVYRSHKVGVPRAVEFVRGADPQVLFVVEALLSHEESSNWHFLLALRRKKAADEDVGSADSWRVEQRERLTTAPTAWDEEQNSALCSCRRPHRLRHQQIEAARADLFQNLLICIDISTSAAGHC